MRRISARGSGRPARAPATGGYILVEAIALLAVLGIGATAVVAATAAGMRELHRQAVRTAALIEEENAQARGRIGDLPLPE